MLAFYHPNSLSRLIVPGVSCSDSSSKAFQTFPVQALLFLLPFLSMTDTCQTLLSGVVTLDVRHIDQPQLTAAALAAGKRALGDTGMWVWSRRSATSDITPIQSATLALHGAMASKAVRPQRRSGRRGPLPTRGRAAGRTGEADIDRADGARGTQFDRRHVPLLGFHSKRRTAATGGV